MSRTGHRMHAVAEEKYAWMTPVLSKSFLCNFPPAARWLGARMHFGRKPDGVHRADIQYINES